MRMEWEYCLYEWSISMQPIDGRFFSESLYYAFNSEWINVYNSLSLKYNSKLDLIFYILGNAINESASVIIFYCVFFSFYCWIDIKWYILTLLD
jgi:hypothetical protein